jgi:hypothetical protein
MFYYVWTNVWLSLSPKIIPRRKAVCDLGFNTCLVELYSEQELNFSRGEIIVMIVVPWDYTLNSFIFAIISAKYIYLWSHTEPHKRNENLLVCLNNISEISVNARTKTLPCDNHRTSAPSNSVHKPLLISSQSALKILEPMVLIL